MSVRRTDKGMTIADDIKADGQVGIASGDDGTVWVCVLPAKGCFPASTTLGRVEALAIAEAIVKAAL